MGERKGREPRLGKDLMEHGAMRVRGKAMKCPTCGAENPVDRSFCGDCGSLLRPEQPVQPARSTTSGRGAGWGASHWKALVSVVVAIAILVAIIAIVVLNPFVPTYRATLGLTVKGNLNQPFVVFVDGKSVTNGTLIQWNDHLSWYTATITMNVTWKGNATHLCNIEVFSSGARHTASVWMTDGVTVGATVTIWP